MEALSGRDTVLNVVASFAASGFAATIFLAFGVILKLLMTSFSISTSTAALIYLCQWLSFGAMSWVLGMFSDRIGVVSSIRMGLLLIVLGLALAWGSFSLFTFVVGFGLLTGAGLSAAFGPMHNLILSNTAKRWQGTSLGVVMAAQGVGPFLLLPLIAQLAKSVGSRTVVGYLFGGAVITFLLSLVLRELPRKREDGTPVATPEDPETTASATGAPNFKLTAAHLFGCASHTIPLVYVVEYARTTGKVSLVAASSILSVISLSSIASRLLTPVLGNIWGGVKTLAAILPLQLVGTFLFVLVAPTGTLWLYWLAAVVFGLGFGSEMVMFSLISRQLFSGRIGLVLGVQLVGAAIGMGGGAYVGALLLQGGMSYQTLFWLALLTGLVAEVATLAVRSDRVDRPPELVAEPAS